MQLPKGTNLMKHIYNINHAEEDIDENSFIAVRKDIHENMISHSDLKMQIVENIKLVGKEVGAVRKGAVANMIYDFKEGYLEKKAKDSYINMENQIL